MIVVAGAASVKLPVTEVPPARMKEGSAMFVLNQMFGTVLVHPDFDAMFQYAFRYTVLVAIIYLYEMFPDVVMAANTFEGYL